MAHPVYSVNRLTDLLDIPDDRLDQCLSELGTIVRTLRMAQAAARAEGDPRPAAEMFPNLRWTDDGSTTATVVDLKSGASISVTAK